MIFPCATHRAPLLAQNFAKQGQLLASSQQHAEACRAYASALDLQPGDERLYLGFRHAVDSYAASLRQTGGVPDLPPQEEGLAELGTVDLDLRFLSVPALRSVAKRAQSHATAEEAAASAAEPEARVALTRAIMESRTATTGYMASAPPTQPLEHFFDLTRRPSTKFGHSVRRMLRVDYAKQELGFIFKEEALKSYAFDALTACVAGDDGVSLRLTLGGEAMELRASNRAEGEAVRAHLARAMAAAKGGAEAPSGVVSHWLASGTVEKEGKLRWASRWLVLSAGRLYVLRSPSSSMPLNVIALHPMVRRLRPPAAPPPAPPARPPSPPPPAPSRRCA